MQLILFDDKAWGGLLPLTWTKPVSTLRIGILTIAEKWEKEMNCSSTPLTQDFLQVKYPCKPSEDSDLLLISSALLPCPVCVARMKRLEPGEQLVLDLEEGQKLRLLAYRPTAEEAAGILEDPYSFDLPLAGGSMAVSAREELSVVDHPWQIFSLNGQEISADFPRVTAGRKSAALPKGSQVLKPENVFVEEGFKGSFFTLNAEAGPIYLGANSEIMEGSVIRGPFVLGEESVIKMGAKIYGPTTIGPFSRAGGEINNSVIQGYSNKGHDGFLGNAVIGEWCNLGADTNNSNLKNNYTEVKLWSYSRKRFVSTGLQFCGLIMGDHSKCGINTMFNTGTVVGVSVNIFGSGFPRVFVPSFSWGGAFGFSDYKAEKAIETAKLVMERRGKELDEADEAIMRHIFSVTAEFRRISVFRNKA